MTSDSYCADILYSECIVEASTTSFALHSFMIVLPTFDAFWSADLGYLVDLCYLVDDIILKVFYPIIIA